VAVYGEAQNIEYGSQEGVYVLQDLITCKKVGGVYLFQIQMSWGRGHVYLFVSGE